MVELINYIDKVKHLPPAPHLLTELFTLLKKPDADSSQIERLILYDPALTASMLQLCNSAMLAPTSPVASLGEAIVRLGFEQLFSLVAVASVARSLSRRQPRRTGDNNDLWRHSVTTAVAAELIAVDRGDDPKLAFTASLLHDIGKLILSEAVPQEYAAVTREVEAGQRSLLAVEKKTLGVEHAEMGGRLMTHWNFPPSLVAAVCFHHRPAAAEPHGRLAALVNLGDGIAYDLGYGHGRGAVSDEGQAEALDLLQLTQGRLLRYITATYAKLPSIHQLFQAGT